MGGTFSYSGIIESKDGRLIPVIRNAGSGQETAMHSKYNPLKEAEAFADTIDESCFFLVILGLAGGYHIEKALEKNPGRKIIVAENSPDDFSFLMRIPTVRRLAEDKRVIFSDFSGIEESVLANYKPAIHGNLTILSLRQWENLFHEEALLFRRKITGTVKLLAADYSVQSHFGKIWQKNILTNLSLAENAVSFNKIKNMGKSEKTAAVIAAGPSLNSSVSDLKKNRDGYFVIATDTAFSALTAYGVKSDAVISIDGQQVSHQHYMDKPHEDTIFVFDLCASPSAVRRVMRKGGKTLFVETGHPLAQYASLCSKRRSFPHIEAGSGTVTIAAASLAKKMGFSRIEFFGADFSYTDGAPYARGTYLEKQFHSGSCRLSAAEKSYTALMFRSPTIRISENKITTEILEAYRASLDDFMRRTKGEPAPEEDYGEFRLKDFKSVYLKELAASFSSEREFDENSRAFMTLLPLCAKLGKGSAFLAYLKTLRYTELI